MLWGQHLDRISWGLGIRCLRHGRYHLVMSWAHVVISWDLGMTSWSLGMRKLCSGRQGLV